MRPRNANQRRVIRAEAGVVALAAVHIAYESLIGIPPADAPGGVHIHRPLIGANLAEDLVLANVDALVRERHRCGSFFAAQRMVLVDERNARDDVRLAHDHVDLVVRGRRHLLQVDGDRVELSRRERAGVQDPVIGNLGVEAGRIDPIDRGDRALV